MSSIVGQILPDDHEVVIIGPHCKWCGPLVTRVDAQDGIHYVYHSFGCPAVKPELEKDWASGFGRRSDAPLLSERSIDGFVPDPEAYEDERWHAFCLGWVMANV